MSWGTDPSIQWPTAARESALHIIERALGTSRGVILTGEWGVGKSRLLHAALDRAAADGARVLWASGAVPTSSEGSLSDQLRDSRLAKPGEWAAEPVVIGLDDAHLLDPVDAASLYAFVRADRVRLVASAMAGVDVPAGVSRLWVERLAERLELPLFTRAEVATVLQARLGGQTSVDCLERLWSATRGNALLLRELTDAAMAEGGLVQKGGIWNWRGELPADPAGRLGALIQLRLNGLRADERELLQLVSLAEPLEADIAAVAGLARAAESLNRSGMVVTERSGLRLRLRLAYPLYSAVILRAMPELVGRRLRRQLADAIEATGMRRSGDVPRMVRLRLEAGQIPVVGDLSAAAESALSQHDYEKAEELARLALPRSDAADTATGVRLVLGQALEGQGRHLEAEDVLSDGPTRPADDEEVIVVRAVNLAFGLGRLPEAIGIVEHGLAHAGDPDRSSLRGARCLLGLLDDRFADVAGAGGALDGAPGRVPRHAGLVGAPVAFACVESGDPEQAWRALSRESPDASRCPERHRLTGGATEWVRGYAALRAVGPVEAAAQLDGMRWWDEGVPRDRIRISLLRARVHRARGNSAAAVEELRRAGALGAPPDWLTTRTWTLAQLAAALAEAGEHAEAVRALVEVRSLGSQRVLYPLARDGTALEMARVSAHVGDRVSAVRQALAVAASAAAAGRRAQSVDALNLAARLGAADEAAGLLPDTSALSGLTALQAHHVRALARWDGDDLDDIAERYAVLGFRPLAAETAAQSARSHRAQGNHRRCRAARVLCQNLLTAFDGTLPPWAGDELLTSPGPAAPLTVREREVAALVAAGQSNQEVADRLCVSVRTVENHLHRTYDKLGITARSELAGRLDPHDCSRRECDTGAAPAGRPL
ncbi:LuxR C-terminal-related transcriptional regulator [Streptomyces sp. NPDC127033]|uniref:LuxR C-terminal-related transcriptional regulator n=1 Tax=Streptomyces sp. NPDC127033 TaxID=3347110 RepID=UPI00365D7D04